MCLPESSAGAVVTAQTETRIGLDEKEFFVSTMGTVTTQAPLVSQNFMNKLFFKQLFLVTGITDIIPFGCQQMRRI